jgi:hypothetical protein
MYFHTFFKQWINRPNFSVKWYLYHGMKSSYMCATLYSLQVLNLQVRHDRFATHDIVLMEYEFPCWALKCEGNRKHLFIIWFDCSEQKITQLLVFQVNIKKCQPKLADASSDCFDICWQSVQFESWLKCQLVLLRLFLQVNAVIVWNTLLHPSPLKLCNVIMQKKSYYF